MNTSETYTAWDLFRAIDCRDAESVYKIVHSGDVDIESTTSLKANVLHKTSPNYFGKLDSAYTLTGLTPLHEAVRRGYSDITELLIQAGANIHATITCSMIENDGRTAYSYGHRFTPLHFAAHVGDIRSAEMLLKAGANAEELAVFDSTPMHVAGKNGQIVQLLQFAGANIEAQDSSGDTPLYNASEHEQPEIVEALLQAGARPNYNNQAESPLHRAAVHGNYSITKLLIDAHADINAQSRLNRTPLHWASHNGHKEVAKLLIDSGADVNIQDEYNKTSLNLALENNQLEIAEIIRNAGGKLGTNQTSNTHQRNSINWRKICLIIAVVIIILRSCCS